MVRDMMPNFELFQPTTLADALTLLDRRGQGHLEDGRRQRQPRLVQGPRQAAQGRDGPRRHRGAQGHPRNRRRHRDRRADDAGGDQRQPDRPQQIRLLAKAAGRVASPQIRNMSSIGGNVCQDARCWYYRCGVSCYRAGGNHLLRRHAGGQNREHALFDANRCIAVTPSDTAPALIVLEAKMVMQDRQGRARDRCRRSIFVGAGDRHHPHDGAEAGRTAGGDAHPQPNGPARSFTSRRSPTVRPGTSRWSTSPRRSR